MRHGLVEWWTPFRLSLKHAKESQGHLCPWFHQVNSTLTFWHFEATTDGRYFADDIFEWIFLKENHCILISLTHICVAWHHVLESTALLIHTFMIIYDNVFNQNQNFQWHPYEHAITEPMLNRYRPEFGTLWQVYVEGSYDLVVYCKTHCVNKQNIKSHIKRSTRMNDSCHSIGCCRFQW